MLLMLTNLYSGHRLRVAFLVTLCFALAPQVAVNAQQYHEESGDVYEAVVRYQIKSWELAASSYCVSIAGRDATKDFLKRFDPLPVKGASSCRKQTKDKVLVVVTDKKNGNRSVMLDVEAIRWITESEVDVTGGYFCGSLCMASGTYHLIRDGTHWTVTSYDVQIQS
jgi:hypothetical protein